MVRSFLAGIAAKRAGKVVAWVEDPPYYSSNSGNILPIREIQHFLP